MNISICYIVEFVYKLMGRHDPGRNQRMKKHVEEYIECQPIQTIASEAKILFVRFE